MVLLSRFPVLRPIHHFARSPPAGARATKVDGLLFRVEFREKLHQLFEIYVDVIVDVTDPAVRWEEGREREKKRVGGGERGREKERERERERDEVIWNIHVNMTISFKKIYINVYDFRLQLTL